MFAGHYAPAFLLRRVFPAAPLWGLLLAVQAVDIGFFLLSFVGVEGARLAPDAPRLVVTDGVWTHSLVMSVAWAAVIGGGVALGGRPRAALAIGVAVLSHWFADLVVHVPDLPLTLDPSTAVGLSLWLHPPWADVLEIGLLLASGAWLRPALPVGARRAMEVCVGALVGMQVLNAVLPTPPGIVAMGIGALTAYLFVPVWGARVDRAVARGAAPDAAASAA